MYHILFTVEKEFRIHPFVLIAFTYFGIEGKEGFLQCVHEASESRVETKLRRQLRRGRSKAKNE